MTSSPSSVFFIFLLLTLLLTISSDLKEDRKALLKFMDKVGHESKTSWLKEADTCKWFGVMCSLDNSSVIYVRIPGAGLVGKIPPDSLGKIKSLRILSLHDNQLSEGLPPDFASLTQLRYVYLQNNNFSGQFPSSVAKWTNLRALDLSGNNFIGPIPENLLTKFPAAAFSGNIYLCRYENFSDFIIPPCEDAVMSQRWLSPFDSPTLNNKKEETLCTTAIVVIAVGSALILLILLSYVRKEWSRHVKEKNAAGVATMAAKAAARGFGKLD